MIGESEYREFVSYGCHKAEQNIIPEARYDGRKTILSETHFSSQEPTMTEISNMQYFSTGSQTEF